MGKTKGRKGKKKGGDAQHAEASSEPVAGSSLASLSLEETPQPEKEEGLSREVQGPPKARSPHLPVVETGSLDQPEAHYASRGASGGRGFGRGRGRGYVPPFRNVPADEKAREYPSGPGAVSGGRGEGDERMAKPSFGRGRGRESATALQATDAGRKPSKLTGIITPELEVLAGEPFASYQEKRIAPQLTLSPEKQQPLPPKQQPGPPTQQPGPPTQQPGPPTQQPLPTKQQPVPTKQQPVPTKQQPVPTKQQPVRPKQQPGPPTQQPLPTKQQPVPPTQQPVPTKQQPLPPKQQPVRPKQQPGPPTQQPLPTKQQPVPPTQQPVPPTQQPLPTKQQPTLPELQRQQASPLQVPQPLAKQPAILKVETRPPSKNPIPRPNIGKLGRSIKLRANFFPLKINGDVTIYHYDVDVKPEVRNKAKTREVVRAFIRGSTKIFSNVYPVFDGKKNMYTHRQLQFSGKHETDVRLEGDGPNVKPFRVTIQLAAQIQLYSLVQFLNGQTRENPQDAIQALDIVFREMPNNRFIPITQYFFTHPGDHAGAGLQFWNGYYQSVRPTAWKTIMLQVDSSVRVFHKGQSVLDLLEEVFGRGAVNKSLTSRDLGIFNDHIKGLAVEIDTATYPMLTRRTYRLIGLSARPASEQQFPMSQEAGPDIMSKVGDYFMQQYNLRLRYPHLHCVQAQPKEKHRYIPMEICIVKKGQQLKKLSDELTSQLIRYSAKPAPEREKEINRIMGDLNFQADKITQAFGISVNKNMVEFNGRVLDAPAIEYKSKRRADVRDGSWNMRNHQFYTGAHVAELAVLCFDSRTNNDTLCLFCRELSKAARDAGLSLPAEPCSISRLRYANEIYDEIDGLLRRFKDIDLIIVVMPSMKSSDIYGEVKRVGDIQIGVVTQCVLPKNVYKISQQTLTNLCQKINAKLGETNAIIPEQMFSPIMKEAVIIMGADVTHPAPGDDTKPSIAAVTGSYDKQAFKYAARISMQAHRQEIIQDLKEVTVQLLRNFRQKLPGEPAPKRIIFYRDGVSEGQFKDVLASELQAIQQACFACSPTYKPLITFIVVQKRHHTRLFCKEERDKVGRSGNVPAGTTVDTDIVHPLEFDFYLCSHNGIQGTSRPAHYYVLYDDSNFSADEIQKLTYQLCHVYARCTRSVSIPAPAYYAHHCAFRGRCYFDRQQEHQEIPEGGTDSQAVLQAMNEKCLLHQDYKGMFFA